MRWCPPQEARAEAGPSPRQLAPRERVARVKLGRLRVVPDRLALIGFRGTRNVAPALQVSVVGFDAATRGLLALRPRGLTWQELRRESARHRARKLILHRKEIL